MEATKSAEPFLKWAGGKRNLLKTYSPLFPKDFTGYYEPFVGGGAVFFHLSDQLKGKPTILGDVNQNLMTAYQILRDNPRELASGLHELQVGHDLAQYLQWRDYDPTTDMGRAMRFIYLNRACFNGLWRENSKGRMNTPIGDTPAEKLFDYDNLVAVSQALQGVELKVGPFYDSGVEFMPINPDGWFIYLDPPYHLTFSSYSKGGFGEEDHRNLAKCAQYWSNHGAKVMVSNSDTEFVRELYAGWDITVVQARRSISADRRSRGKVGELVIRNFT